MIACIGKNNRCKPLFQALNELDKRFRFVGVASAERSAKALGALLSAGSSMERTRQLLEFSPPVTESLERSCRALLESLEERPEAVLYWGATNMPVSGKFAGLPYYILTDGPYDPDDPIYPEIWQPGRWKGRYLELQRKVFSGARHVFTLSEWARQKVIKVHGIDSAKVTKVGWGPLYTLGPALDRSSQGRKIVLSVGNHWHVKGMDLVAEAGALLAKDREDVETVIIGDPRGMSIQPRTGVTLVPHSLPPAVVHSVMRQASLLVVASRFDASPHVIPEAYQYGVPVVGNGVCGIPEAVPADRLLTRFEAQALADLMHRVLAETFAPSPVSWLASAEIVVRSLLG